jgi:hypothetical protein
MHDTLCQLPQPPPAGRIVVVARAWCTTTGTFLGEVQREWPEHALVRLRNGLHHNFRTAAITIVRELERAAA